MIKMGWDYDFIGSYDPYICEYRCPKCDEGDLDVEPYTGGASDIPEYYAWNDSKMTCRTCRYSEEGHAFFVWKSHSMPATEMAQLLEERGVADQMDEFSADRWTSFISWHE